MHPMRTRIWRAWPAVAALALLSACTQADKPQTQAPAAPGKLTAKTYNSGFARAHDTYNAMGAASDGKIYYVLSTEAIDVGAQMYSFDPASGRIDHLTDLNVACGEAGKKMISQGKSHVNFVEHGGKLYFATHIGYYSIIDGMEKPGVPPAGYQPYPGGHLLSYDMASGKFEDLALAPRREGIITMNMDGGRGRIYAITWPAGHLLRYDLAKKEMRDIGPVALDGENGKGKRYRTICRSIAIDPRDGSAYFTNGDGDILRYRPDTDLIETVQGDDMRKDYFGLYDPTSAGHMGYNWRQTAWQPTENVIYGVHGNSGYLFRFDPKAARVEVLQRLTSEPSQRAGMFDQFSYGYLGFALAPDGRSLHYLTGGPIYVEGRRVLGKASTAKGESKGQEDLHLITYDIPTSRYTDHGAIFFRDGQRPSYVNSIAVGKDRTTYFLSRVTENGATRADLVAVPLPK